MAANKWMKWVFVMTPVERTADTRELQVRGVEFYFMPDTRRLHVQDVLPEDDMTADHKLYEDFQAASLRAATTESLVFEAFSKARGELVTICLYLT